MKYTVEVDLSKTIRWSKEGTNILHREDGPAVEYANGDKLWYQNGELHREDGPAVEYANGYKSWFINGKRHREDGPAIESPNSYKFWYYQDLYINCNTQEDFERIIKEKFNHKTNLCTDKIINIDGKNFKLVPVE